MRRVRPSYLDPATGSYVIQMVIAGFLGAFYALRGYIRAFFGGAPAEGEEEGEEESDEDAPAPEPGEGDPGEDGADPGEGGEPEEKPPA